MTKSAQFFPVRTYILAEDYARLYLHEIVKLYRIPILIFSNRGMQFSFHFLWLFQKGLDTMVSRSTAFHPQMDGQAARNIKTLEDTLRAYVI